MYCWSFFHLGLHTRWGSSDFLDISRFHLSFARALLYVAFFVLYFHFCLSFFISKLIILKWTNYLVAITTVACSVGTYLISLTGTCLNWFSKYLMQVGLQLLLCPLGSNIVLRTAWCALINVCFDHMFLMPLSKLFAQFIFHF